MSKKNKIVYSDIQPNAKEAGVWVNTTDGNVKIEKDGKWVDDGGSGSGDDQNGPLYYKFVENQYLDSELNSGSYPNVFSECRHAGVMGPLWGTPQWLQSFLGSNFTQSVWADAFVFMPCDYLDSSKKYRMFKTYEELREMISVLPEAIRITKEEYYEGRNIE